MHYKADINAPDNDGNTPLHLSTANGHEKVKRGAFWFRVEQRMCPKWPRVDSVRVPDVGWDCSDGSRLACLLPRPQKLTSQNSSSTRIRDPHENRLRLVWLPLLILSFLYIYIIDLRRFFCLETRQQRGLFKSVVLKSCETSITFDFGSFWKPVVVLDALQFCLLIQTSSLMLSFQCTKALVFFDMQVNVMKINAANEQGDTPLHLASRWGYGKITWVVRGRLSGIMI